VNETQFDPLAQIMLDAYRATAELNQSFREDHGQPMTTMAKVHVMRSVMQADIIRHERYQLGQPFAEYGRVQVTDSEDGRDYLLRSAGAVAVERATGEPSLFDNRPYISSDVVLLVYLFEPSGLALSVAGTRRANEGRRLLISGQLAPVGSWSWTTAPNGLPFDQGEVDLFNELREINIDGDEGEETG
jgi:hypothetical protein